MKNWLKLIRLNTMLFAFLFTLVACGFQKNFPLNLTFLTAIVFALIAMSIMVFNDMIDGQHDLKKGKTFTNEHSSDVGVFWKLSCLSTVSGLLLIWFSSHILALFMAGVWLLGLLYSFFPLFYIGNNIIVALCSASPALCSVIYHCDITVRPVLYFVVVFCVIFIREILKDIEDREADWRYKATLPVKTVASHCLGDNIYDYIKSLDLFRRYNQMIGHMPRQNNEFISSFKVIAYLLNAVFFVTVFIRPPWSLAVAILLMSAKVTGFLFLNSSDLKWVKLSKRILDFGLICLLALACM